VLLRKGRGKGKKWPEKGVSGASPEVVTARPVDPHVRAEGSRE